VYSVNLPVKHVLQLKQHAMTVLKATIYLGVHVFHVIRIAKHAKILHLSALHAKLVSFYNPITV